MQTLVLFAQSDSPRPSDAFVHPAAAACAAPLARLGYDVRVRNTPFDARDIRRAFLREHIDGESAAGVVIDFSADLSERERSREPHARGDGSKPYRCESRTQQLSNLAPTETAGSSAEHDKKARLSVTSSSERPSRAQRHCDPRSIAWRVRQEPSGSSFRRGKMAPSATVILVSSLAGDGQKDGFRIGSGRNIRSIHRRDGRSPLAQS